MKKHPVAIQLFSLREETEKDFAGTLKKVADMGYDGVEFAGYGNLEAAELKEVLDNLGLKAAGAHVGLKKLEEELDSVMAFQKTIGNQYIVCPFLPEEYQASEAGYRKAAEKLNEIGKTCAEHGMTLCYHNHDFELKKVNGIQPLNILLSEENVSAELDIYWLKKAGENPSDWIKQYKQKVPLLHVKDMTTDGKQFFAELGTGGIDVREAIDIGKATGIQWFIVEQDQSEIGALESAKVSMDYLIKHSLF